MKAGEEAACTVSSRIGEALVGQHHPEPSVPGRSCRSQTMPERHSQYWAGP